jgi:hypothetical protein
MDVVMIGAEHPCLKTHMNSCQGSSVLLLTQARVEGWGRALGACAPDASRVLPCRRLGAGDARQDTLW